MPVLVTGAEDALGRRTAHRLLATGGEVRVWLDDERSGHDDAARWRALGSKAAIGAADDEGRLEAALEQVHTVADLAGDALEDPAEGTDRLATVASAALGAGCRRLIWVTELAVSLADEVASPGAYVRALAERSALTADLPIDVVEIRTGLRYGPGDRVTALLARHAGELQHAVPHAPVWVDDVAATVVAADAQRGAEAPVRLVVDLVGPDVLPLGRVSRALADALAAGASDTALPPAVADWLRIPAGGGADALGSQGRSFEEGVRLLQRAREEERA